jgi:hypothetical protein
MDKMLPNLKWVKCGPSFIKWGKTEQFLLNRVIVVTMSKLEGKIWNSLKILSRWILILFLKYSAMFLARVRDV